MYPRALLPIVLLGVAAAWSAGSPGPGFAGEEGTEEPPFEEPLAARIDRHLEAAWRKARRRPARCDDATFLRRLSLDLLGRVPEAEEVLAFSRDRNPGKYEEKVDEYLSRSEAAYRWGTIWTRILLGRPSPLDPPGLRRDTFHAWVRRTWKEAVPWDRVVRRILLAEGEHDRIGPVAFWFRYTTGENLAGAVARHFLGLRIQCAQCHDHPYESWTRRDFYGMVAFLARTEKVRRRERRGDDPEPMDVWRVRDRPRGEARLPETLERIEPRFLTGAVPAGGENRRAALARLVTAPANPWFARAFVNRIWALYVGTGFVEPVDDLGSGSADALLPGLFEELARAFVRSGFDTRRLVRGILLSKAYRVACRRGRQRGPFLFDARRPRPLTPEQLFYSILQATGLEDVTDEKVRQRLERRKDRILQQFVYTFADDEEADELAFDGTIPQALFLMNGAFVADAIRHREGSTLARALRAARTVEDRVRYLFLATLSRLPAPAELRACTRYVRRTGEFEKAYEDLLWALINSAEFLYDH